MRVWSLVRACAAQLLWCIVLIVLIVLIVFSIEYSPFGFVHGGNTGLDSRISAPV